MADSVLNSALDQKAPYIYPDFNEVPEPWRRIQGGRLNLDQVNAILADAYANGRTNEHGHFLPDHGGARQRFMASHCLVDGWWAARTEGGN